MLEEADIILWNFDGVAQNEGEREYSYHNTRYFEFALILSSGTSITMRDLSARKLMNK